MDPWPEGRGCAQRSPATVQNLPFTGLPCGRPLFLPGTQRRRLRLGRAVFRQPHVLCRKESLPAFLMAFFCPGERRRIRLGKRRGSSGPAGGQERGLFFAARHRPFFKDGSPHPFCSRKARQGRGIQKSSAPEEETGRCNGRRRIGFCKEEDVMTFAVERADSARHL